MNSTKEFVWCYSARAEVRSTSTIKLFKCGQVENSTKHFYSLDHLGSIRELTNLSGGIESEYRFDPFGRIGKIKENVVAPLQYCGYYFLERSGLYSAVWRQYSPVLSKWISRDLISSVNSTTYVDQNPITFYDGLGDKKVGPWIDAGSNYGGWRPTDGMGTLQDIKGYTSAVMAANNIDPPGSSPYGTCMFNCLQHAIAGAALSMAAGAGGGGAVATAIGALGVEAVENVAANVRLKAAVAEHSKNPSRENAQRLIEALHTYQESMGPDTPLDIKNTNEGASAVNRYYDRNGAAASAGTSAGGWIDILSDILDYCNSQCCDKPKKD